MQAEIITVGTEILLGQIVDTNSAYLARQLADIGFDVYRKSTIGDNEQRIARALRTALKHTELVIISGGIGPTVDDKTREAVAAATGCKLVLHEESLHFIKEYFRRRGLEFGDNNRRQAYIPENSIPIRNPVGTAPGFIIKSDNSRVIALPGVPRELYHLMEKTVLPYIHKEFNPQTVIKSRILHTAGSGESFIDMQISDLEESSNPTVGLLSYPGAVDIRIAAKARDNEQAFQLLDTMEMRIRQRLGDTIFGIDEQLLEEVVVDALAARQLEIGLLENNTGGRLADRMTGSDKGLDVVKKALTLPFRQIKSRFLDDLPEGISMSGELSETLAEIIRENSDADIGLVIIGDESPHTGPYSKQTGNTYIGIKGSGEATSLHLKIGGISSDARTRLTNNALEQLRQYLHSGLA